MDYSSLVDCLERNLLPCGVKQLTGLNCPGCGLQTAFVALLRGDIAGSIGANPALIPLIGLFVFVSIHIKAGFKKGPQVILWLFGGTVALMIVNYIARFALLW